ncbi:MAG TPA: N-acetylglucosamine-6-phosphate deacetylase [Anaerolineaceae bacterium]|nr:N-acetylglucosamine-6-phosphate deacetylase [Anaerolineaceae bacterium]
MLNKIIHANIYTPDKLLPDQTIEIKDGKIHAIYPTRGNEKKDTTFFDAQDMIITPGLMDIHTHGGMGADAMDAQQNSLNQMSTFLANHGVTSFLATTMTAEENSIDAALSTIRESHLSLPGATLVGAHIEGPYINITYKGAQNPAYFRPPQEQEYRRWIETGIVKMVTIAPEIEGMDEFIQYCIYNDVEIAIGHSNASYDQVMHAADLGARHATHLFNGMLGLHHREPGTVGGILSEPRISAHIIVDGVHLHPAIVDLVVRLKGADKTILISDAMRAAGLADGRYDLGGQEVTVVDGEARIANGSLAGSTLTLERALKNVMQFCHMDLIQALPMVTRNPAKALHLADCKGFIREGFDADLTIFNRELEVQATMVQGKWVYKKS